MRGFFEVSIIKGLAGRVAMNQKPGPNSQWTRETCTTQSEMSVPVKCQLVVSNTEHRCRHIQEFLCWTNIPLSFSYHKMQLLPLMPVWNTLCHSDRPISKKGDYRAGKDTKKGCKGDKRYGSVIGRQRWDRPKLNAASHMALHLMGMTVFSSLF